MPEFYIKFAFFGGNPFPSAVSYAYGWAPGLPLAKSGPGNLKDLYTKTEKSKCCP